MVLSVEEIRDNWLRGTLGQLPAGETILDVGEFNLSALVTSNLNIKIIF